jgi:hypothetical protein
MGVENKQISTMDVFIGRLGLWAREAVLKGT